MENLSYKLEQFEGPLDLLLSLIAKNKVDISDIPISLICDQYMEYLDTAQKMDLELATEFIIMASELMLIKSKMLLPRPEEEKEDPRKDLAEALLQYQRAKAAAEKLAPLYAFYSGRMIKDTDEISPDRKFVAEHDMALLEKALKKILLFNKMLDTAEKTHFSPMIKKPVVSVEVKITGVLKKLKETKKASLSNLVTEAESRSELIAIFIAVLELVKMRHILIVDGEESGNIDENVMFSINPEKENGEVEINLENLPS